MADRLPPDDILLNSPCSWHESLFARRDTPLGEFIHERATWEGDCDRFCDQDDEVATVCTQYIECVPLDEIEDTPPWNEMREKSVRDWGNRHTLNRIPVDRTLDCGSDVIAATQKHGRMVRVSRNYDLRKPLEEQEKFRISDGIHRTNRAREVGAGCILAIVNECVSFRKSDRDLYTRRPK